MFDLFVVLSPGIDGESVFPCEELCEVAAVRGGWGDVDHSLEPYVFVEPD